MDKSKWERLGIETSKLGFGCMRFPVKGNGEIDEVKARNARKISASATISRRSSRNWTPPPPK